jgi:hypothetical protein
MNFEIHKASGQDIYDWTLLDGGAVIAASGEASYRSLGLCRSAIERIKAHADNAAILTPGQQVPANDPRLRFLLSEDAAGFIWTLTDRRGLELGRSVPAYQTLLEVRQAVTSIKTDAHNADIIIPPLDLPLCAFTFDTSTLPARWGHSLQINALPTTTFGASGSAFLAGPERATQKLLLLDWASTTPPTALRFPLPTHAPSGWTSFAIIVEPLGFQPCEQQLILDPAGVDVLQQVLDDLVAAVTLDVPNLPTGAVPLAQNLPVHLRDFPPARVSIPGRSASVPLSRSVTWTFTDEDGNAVGSDRVKNLNSALEAATFIFVPRPISAPAPPGRRDTLTLVVRVTASAEGIEATPKTLSLPIAVDPLVIPTIAALFNHVDFSPDWARTEPACVLLVANGPITGLDSVDSVITAIGVLSDTIGLLARHFASFVWLRNVPPVHERLARVTESLRAIARHFQNDMSVGPKLRFDSGPAVAELERNKFFTSGLYTLSAEDVFGSAFVLSAPRGWPTTSLSMYVARHFDNRDGYFAVSVPTGDIVVLMSNLHATHISTEPPNHFGPVAFPPHGGNFGNSISSLHFGPRP